MKKILLALCALALPAFAQTTTTVQTQPAPPPPSSPSTQVVVNPNENPPPPPARVRVETEAAPTVETVPTGRSAGVIIATDALYGGFTGALIGGAVTLIDQGNNWQRDLMVGAGVGVLAGAGFGIYEAATQPTTRVVTRAAADRDGAASDSSGMTLLAAGSRF